VEALGCERLDSLVLFSELEALFLFPELEI